MAKTKLRNFRAATTLVRPDGTQVEFRPGVNEVSTETYDVGKVKGADDKEVDHPLKGKSDFTHWHVEANSDTLETKEEREAAEAENAKALTPAPGGPIGTSAPATTNPAKSDGNLTPGKVSNA